MACYVTKVNTSRMRGGGPRQELPHTSHLVTPMSGRICGHLSVGVASATASSSVAEVVESNVGLGRDTA